MNKKRPNEGRPMKGAESEAADYKVSALRSALRSAPPKNGARSRSPLKAAVAQLLPDLLALRAKGYNSAELAELMHDNGFTIAAATLNKYINEARSRTGSRRRKRKMNTTQSASSTAAKPDSRASNAVKKIVVPPSLLATKPLSPSKRTAKDVLGHRFDDEL
jgi:hypothetical protein